MLLDRLSCAWRQVAATLLVGLALLLAGAGAVRAVDIPSLQSAVTDQTGALSGQEPQIQDALQQLFTRTGVQVYVLFVPTTGGMDIGAYAAAVGEQSLGPDDALLTVALQERADNITTGVNLRSRVSQSSLDQVRTNVLEPGLASGDYGGAVISTVNALGNVFPPLTPPSVAPTAAPTPTATPPPGEPAQGSSGTAAFLILLIIAIVIVVGAAWLIARMRQLRSDRQAAFEEAKTQEQLGRQANKTLIKTDDDLRDAEQQLGFAETEFGSERAKPLRDSLAGARDELNAAFTIGQKLDDDEPETPDQRRQMIQDIITGCQKAEAVIAAQTAELGRLRDLERNAADVLTRLDGDLASAQEQLTTAAADKQRLTKYADASTASVAGNLDKARDKLALAQDTDRCGTRGDHGQRQGGRGERGERRTGRAPGCDGDADGGEHAGRLTRPDGDQVAGRTEGRGGRYRHRAGGGEETAAGTAASPGRRPDSAD